ncbi:MAG: M48 family metallopeptidase [Rothia sp. (in: high G+C Gram-positive bacteria)]|nr:M48 family metallopeptidase [Rothia sp. (in: high G+C Gram-positive bacteria)]
MGGRKTEIIPAADGRPEVEIVRSARRQRTVQAQPLDGGRVRLLVPARSSDADIAVYLERLLPKVAARQDRRAATVRQVASDEFLVGRAEALRAELLPECPAPASIRWVGNQKKQWGSATPLERSIRISDTLQGAPGYAVDSVIFHELCHFVEPNHSRKFRALEARYPYLEKARAFLEGVTFGQHSGAYKGSRS